MSKKFDAESYVSRWDAKVIPAMLVLIVASLVAVVVLNVASRPDCLRHEYIFCGTEEVLKVDSGHHAGHGDDKAEGHGHSQEAGAGEHPH
jgi:hypothetical protein